MNLNLVIVVLSIGVAVLGSWTSLILLEQALINYKYHGMYMWQLVGSLPSPNVRSLLPIVSVGDHGMVGSIVGRC